MPGNQVGHPPFASIFGGLIPQACPGHSSTSTEITEKSGQIILTVKELRENNLHLIYIPTIRTQTRGSSPRCRQPREPPVSLFITALSLSLSSSVTNTLNFSWFSKSSLTSRLYACSAFYQNTLPPLFPPGQLLTQSLSFTVKTTFSAKPLGNPPPSHQVQSGALHCAH